MKAKTKDSNKPYLFRFTEAKEGYSELASSKNAPLNHLSVGRLRLTRNKEYSSNTKNKEVLLHVLVGKCNIETSNTVGRKSFSNIGERVDVFSGLPESLLLSPGTKYTITPVTPTVDIVVSEVDLDSKPYNPVVFKQKDIDVRIIGEKYFKREVRPVLGGEGRAKKLRAGETINGTGLWSSWPHHSFDKNRQLHPEFEEVFLFFVKPKESYGLVRVDGIFCTGQKVDGGIVVKNGDWAIMPIGDHPVVSAPDSQIYYFWAYISPIPKIYSKWAEDQGGYA